MNDAPFAADAASARYGVPRHWLRSRTLSAIRWMAIGGQLATVLAADFALGFNLPLLWCLLTIAASAWFNVLTNIAMPANARLPERLALIWLLFDATQLTILLALTGGLNNPFTLLFLAPVTVAAATLGPRSVWIVGGIIVIYICVLEFAHLPLRFENGEIFAIESQLYRLGVWCAMLVGVVFFAFYVRRVANEAHSMSEALSATQLALAREQKLSSLGALLAATAHQLGTPLATIAVAAKEIERELADRPDLHEDIQLIGEQTRRCRDILGELNHSRHGVDEEQRGAPLAALVEEAAAPFHGMGKTIELRLEAAEEDGDKLTVARRPEIIHGLRNLIQNAVDYATTTAYVAMHSDSSRTEIVIADDGPGYAPEALGRLGEPFATTRGAGGGAGPKADREGYQGMGLGVFIAKTLLERTGARVAFRNGGLRRHDGAMMEGAVVRVAWRNRELERPASAV